jgi:hypothetical protein
VGLHNQIILLLQISKGRTNKVNGIAKKQVKQHSQLSGSPVFSLRKTEEFEAVREARDRGPLLWE